MKHLFMVQICELIKSAICDADPETRTAGRKAFHKFDLTHPDEAERIFQSLDQAKQKVLRAADAGSSCNSVNSERGTTPLRSKLSSGSIGGLKTQAFSSSKRHCKIVQITGFFIQSFYLKEAHPPWTPNK